MKFPLRRALLLALGPCRPSAQSGCEWFVFALLLTAFAASGCASQKAQPKQNNASPASYLRIAHPDEDTIELQVASRRFVPAHGKGAEIWLVGASHIGESNFYAAIQRQLDSKSLVLFEGVGEHSRRARDPGDTPAPPPRMKPPANDDDYSLQDTMAKSLGLVFQLQAIDYDRTNFLNSDLSIAEIQALMQPGRSPNSSPASATPARNPNAAPGTRRPLSDDDDDANSSFQSLLNAMNGQSALGVLLKGMMQLIGNSPKFQAMTKIVLIEALGAMKGDPTRMKGMPDDMKQLMEVLIRERNKVVLEDLKAELKRKVRGQSIAIFYGAAHLTDLETRLKKELKYKPAGEIWSPAFSVNTTRAGLSNFEMNFLRSMIRSQLGPMTE